MLELLDDTSDAPQTTRSKAPGRVRFDARGNAIYEWNDVQLELDGEQGEQLRERALLNPTLSLVDDTPAPQVSAVRNDKGLRVGYNPYQSGQLAGKKPLAKKPDMRELSKWIETKRRLEAQKDDIVSVLGSDLK